MKIVKVINQTVEVREKIVTVHHPFRWSVVAGLTTFIGLLLYLDSHWIASVAGVVVAGVSYFIGKKNVKKIREQ